LKIHLIITLKLINVSNKEKLISYFLNKTEDMHLNIRQDIYEEAFRRINILPNVVIDTERGRFKILD